jgi:hypothetical protein
MVPHKDNITARPKVNLPCNTNRHLLNRAVERRAAAVVVWLVAWPLCAVAALLKKDVNAAWSVAIVFFKWSKPTTLSTISTIRLMSSAPMESRLSMNRKHNTYLLNLETLS